MQWVVPKTSLDIFITTVERKVMFLIHEQCKIHFWCRHVRLLASRWSKSPLLCRRNKILIVKSTFRVILHHIREWIICVRAGVRYNTQTAWDETQSQNTIYRRLWRNCLKITFRFQHYYKINDRLLKFNVLKANISKTAALCWRNKQSNISLCL